MNAGCAKPSQSSNWGAETCAKCKLTSPYLLAIPTFDRIAGLYNRHLKSNRGICLCWRFWSQAEGLDWSTQRLVLRWHWTNYDGDKLCLVGCLGSEPRLAQSQNASSRLFQALRWSRHAWGRGVRAMPRLCILYPDICLMTEENHGKPQSG